MSHLCFNEESDYSEEIHGKMKSFTLPFYNTERN